MKKKYYIVHVTNKKDNSYIPFVCETIIKIDTEIFGQAYIFRDLITGKIIRPFFDASISLTYKRDIGTLTYDNTNKNNYKRISQKKVLTFLKGINNDILDSYQKTLNDLEKKNIKILTI